MFVKIDLFRVEEPVQKVSCIRNRGKKLYKIQLNKMFMHGNFIFSCIKIIFPCLEMVILPLA